MTNSDNSGSNENPPSLLPYNEWIEAAYREVMLKALESVAKNGLPGSHNFYIQFKTDYPDVIIPPQLKEKYPEEMTIVLQHQFWDLKINRIKQQMSVGLSFGGVGSILVIPFGSIIGFADPFISLAFNFQPIPSGLTMIQSEEKTPVQTLRTVTNNIEELKDTKPSKESNASKEKSQVISLDAFRKKTD